MMNTCRQHQVFLALSALQVLLLNIAYIGPGFNDDPVYINNAMQVLAERSPALGPIPVRNLLIMPLAASFGFFGINDLAIRVLSTLWGVAGLTTVYALGLRVQGKLLALVASLFWMVFPLIFQHATQIVADIPAGICSAIAVLCFLRGGLFSAEDGSPEIRWHLAGGLFTGLAYLGKTPAVLVLFLPLLDALLHLKHGRISRKGLAAAAGALIVWSGEGLMYLLVAHDFFFHYHHEAKYYLDPLFLRYNRTADLWLYPRLMFTFEKCRGTYPFALFFYLGVPGLLVAAIQRRKASVALSIWFLILLIYHEFGSMSLTHYILVDRTARYFCVLAIPTVLLAALFVAFLVMHRRKAVRAVGAVTFLAALIVASIQSLHAYRHDHGGVMDYRGVWDFIHTTDPRIPIFFDNGLIPRMQFLDGTLHPKHSYRSFEPTTNCDQLRGAYVVLSSLNFLGEPNLYPRFRACLEGLTPVATIRIPGQIGMFSTYDPIIYFIPPQPAATPATSVPVSQ